MRGKRDQGRSPSDNQMPVFPRAKKGEEGRVSTGRFNRSFAMEKMKLLQGGSKDAKQPSDKSRTNNGFKSKFNDGPHKGHKKPHGKLHGKHHGKGKGGKFSKRR